MRLLLVSCVGDEGDYTENKYPPLGLGYLASYLRENLSQLDIRIATRNIENAMSEWHPDIVGISSVSQNFNRAREIASLCKQFHAGVVVGGVHISSLPACLNADMDVGVIGEGEETLLELVRLYDRTWDSDSLSRVSGIVYHRGNSLEITPERPLIEPLDRLPFPARELLGNEGNEAYMFTSRGCPYRCLFCASSRYWAKWRLFSAKYVVEEIKNLRKHYPAIRSIKMFDDLFIGDKKRLKEIVQLVKYEGLHKRIKFLVSATANLIDDEIISLLKQMNVTEVGIGLESGCDNTLRFLKRGVTSVEDNCNAVRKLKENGIWVTGTCIIGSPNETKNDIVQTLSFIRSTPLDKVSVFVLIPYPNTPLWDIVVQKQLIPLGEIDSVDWSILNQDFLAAKDRFPILSDKLSRAELEELLMLFRREERRIAGRWALKLVFRQPSKVANYILRRLRRPL